MLPPLSGVFGEVWDANAQAWIRPERGPAWRASEMDGAAAWLRACPGRMEEAPLPSMAA